MEEESDNKIVTMGEKILYEQEVEFCTLGMFILDEIHYLPPKPPVYNVLGGGGTYSALGARLFSPPPLAKMISWIVDAGSDFPPELASLIDSWNTSCLFRTDSSRLTTRGWNGYDSAETRAFKYTTPKLRLTDADLSPSLLFSKSFHLLCSPIRCIELCTSILRRRKALNPSAPKPIFIWEPVPDLCIPDELLNCTNALPYIDICSPNANELASLLGDSELDPLTGAVSLPFVEQACEQLISSMPLQSYALVIRCGAQGCYVAQNTPSLSSKPKPPKSRKINQPRGGLTAETDMFSLFAAFSTSSDGSYSFEREEVEPTPGVEEWLPAYFTSGDAGKGRVVDPTGGGNGFLGGMSVALARGKGVVEAAAWGSVAAGFMIEQVGVPVLSLGVGGRKGGERGELVGEGARCGEEDGEEREEQELWNGEGVEARLDAFRERCGPW